MCIYISVVCWVELNASPQRVIKINVINIYRSKLTSDSLWQQSEVRNYSVCKISYLVQGF